jgi:hypothetical protein
MAFEPKSVPRPPDAGDPVSATTLLNRLLDDATALVRNEVALAKAEFTQSINAIKLTVSSMAAGTVVLVAGMLTLVAAAVLGLAEVVAPWLAALIVGLALAIVGFALIQGAKRKLASANLSLERTGQSLRKDAAVAARRTS